MANEAFKFPDENEVNVNEKGPDVQVEMEDEPKVEVEQDEKPKHSRLGEEPKPLQEDELGEYSDRVKKRIDHLYKGYKTKQTEAEQAKREAEEAIRVAQALIEENKKLKGSLNQGQQALLDQAKKVVTNEVEQAKRKYKDAYESGDADRLVAAQEELTAAKIKLDKVNNFKPAPLQQQKNEVQIAQPKQAPVDPKAETWAQENASWFGKDKEMTSFAFGYHAKLVDQGIDPASDEYYERLNSRMRKVFPEAFGAEEPPETTQRQRQSNVVAPATRSTAPKKVVLSKEQVNIAKRLGLTPEQYARELVKLQRNG
jgi:hypothetical protein